MISQFQEVLVERGGIGILVDQPGFQLQASGEWACAKTVFAVPLQQHLCFMLQALAEFDEIRFAKLAFADFLAHRYCVFLKEVSRDDTPLEPV